MHERLLAAVGDRTYRLVGELTGTHPETVRRYLQGQAPSVEFVASLSNALGINADWLLTGRGPMKSEELRAHVLSQADPGELMRAMSSNIESLLERVQRVEIFMQTLETRIRALQPEIAEGLPSIVDARSMDGPQVVSKAGRRSESAGPASDPPRESPRDARQDRREAPCDQREPIQRPEPPELIPNDHARLLVELLQPLGPELTRRWVAALLLVHREERERVVTEVEKSLARLYPLDELDRRANEPAGDLPGDVDIKRPRRAGDGPRETATSASCAGADGST